MKTRFILEQAGGYTMKVKIIYRYREDDTGARFTSCMVFLYNKLNELPEHLNLQTATFAGFARCSPNDQFSKDTGRKLCLSRAIVTLSKRERKQFWENYHGDTYGKV